MAVFLCASQLTFPSIRLLSTNVVHGQVGWSTQKQRVLPLPYYYADYRVLNALVLLWVFYELDKYKWVNLAAPCLLAVHA